MVRGRIQQRSSCGAGVCPRRSSFTVHISRLASKHSRSFTDRGRRSTPINQPSSHAARPILVVLRVDNRDAADYDRGKSADLVVTAVVDTRRSLRESSCPASSDEPDQITRCWIVGNTARMDTPQSNPNILLCPSCIQPMRLAWHHSETDGAVPSCGATSADPAASTLPQRNRPIPKTLVS